MYLDITFNGNGVEETERIWMTIQQGLGGGYGSEKFGVKAKKGSKKLTKAVLAEGAKPSPQGDFNKAMNANRAGRGGFASLVAAEKKIKAGMASTATKKKRASSAAANAGSKGKKQPAPQYKGLLAQKRAAKKASAPAVNPFDALAANL